MGKYYKAYKVEGIHNERKNRIEPTITISGNYLKKVGFEIGTEFDIVFSETGISILKLTEEQIQIRKRLDKLEKQIKKANRNIRKLKQK